MLRKRKVLALMLVLGCIFNAGAQDKGVTSPNRDVTLTTAPIDSSGPAPVQISTIIAPPKAQPVDGAYPALTQVPGYILNVSAQGKVVTSPNRDVTYTLAPPNGGWSAEPATSIAATGPTAAPQPAYVPAPVPAVQAPPGVQTPPVVSPPPQVVQQEPQAVEPSAQQPLVEPTTPVVVAPQPRPGYAAPEKPTSPFVYGMGNLLLGLGSALQGDRGGSLGMTIFEVASLGLLWWETSLDFNDPLAGYPGLVGLLGLGGSVLYGFIRPAIYAKNQRLAQMLDSIELAPVAHDKTGLKLVLQAPLE